MRGLLVALVVAVSAVVGAPPAAASPRTGPSAAVLAAFGARFVLKLSVERAFKTYAGPVWLLPIRDIISFAVFLLSFFGQQVAWRGARFQVGPSGAMSQL